MNLDQDAENAALSNYYVVDSRTTGTGDAAVTEYHVKGTHTPGWTHRATVDAAGHWSMQSIEPSPSPIPEGSAMWLSIRAVCTTHAD